MSNLDIDDVPYIREDLIKHLNARFPDRSPHIEDSEREIWMKAGERRLVTWLVQQFKDQQERSLINVLPISSAQD